MGVNTKIQVRRDTAAMWTSVNPTLAAGEIGFETDTSRFKVGTGSAAWTSLAYQGIPTGGAAGTLLAKNSATDYDTTWLATPLPIANGGTNSTATPTSGGVGYGTGTAHAYTGAGTSGQVLQSAGTGVPVWATYARGFIAQDTSTAGATYFSSTTAYTDTDLSIAPTVVSGRKYKWTIQGHVYTDGAPDVIRIALRTSGSVLLTAVDTLVNSAGSAECFSLVYYETASSTALSRKVSVARASGSGTNVYFFADATRTATLTLEDVGI